MSFTQAPMSFTQAPTTYIDDPNEPIEGLVSRYMQWCREDNNAKTNCGFLTDYALYLLETLLAGRKPERKIVDTSSSSLTTPTLDTHGPVVVKKEDGVLEAQMGTLSSYDVPTASGLNARPSMIAKSHMDIDSGDETILLDPHPTSTPLPRVNSPAELDKTLMRLADHENSIIYGKVLLKRPDNRSGHVFAFCASSEKVFYVDGQLYDGANRKGSPIFESLTKAVNSKGNRAYYFSNEDEKDIPEEGKNKKYQAGCFYLITGRKSLKKSLTSAPVALLEGAESKQSGPPKTTPADASQAPPPPPAVSALAGAPDHLFNQHNRRKSRTNTAQLPGLVMFRGELISQEAYQAMLSQQGVKQVFKQ